jgi:SAM-dependent methyltransferase
MLLSDKCRRTAFPIRALRYWYVAQSIRAFAREREENICVSEIGINVGEMRRFYQHHCQVEGQLENIDRWDGVDVDIERAPGKLYSTLCQHDLNGDNPLPASGYDVVVLLHVLEHLADPEIVFSRVCETLVPGGIVIGGFPSTPNFLLQWKQRRLRKTAKPFGHVSCFSRRRTEQLAERHGLEICYLSCAFVLRQSGSPLENFEWWARGNVIAGALCRSFPTELVWCFRKSQQ